MLDTFLEWLKRVIKSRLLPIAIIYLFLISILINRIFVLQIVEGEEIVKESQKSETGKREIKSTRGRILDYKGNVLAYNELSYSVTLEDTGELKDNKSKNAMIYKLINIIEKNGGTIVNDFYIELNEDGIPIFNIEGKAIERFKKDLYSIPYKKELTEEEKAQSAEDIFDYIRYDTSSISFQVGDEYSKEDALKIMSIRYALFMNRYSKYVPITVANGVDDITVSAIKENSADLPGVEILFDSHRVYNDSKYFAQMLGYTGVISSEQLTELKESGTNHYTATDQIGKTGLEKEYETYLHGINGYEEVLLNESRRIVAIKERVEPVAGNDLYLTIDADMQKACYDLLEKKIAGILLSNIVNSTSTGSKGVSSDDIKIPIYDVYFALIENGIIDITQFNDKAATPLERNVYNKYIDKRKSVFNQLDNILSVNSTVTNQAASDEMEEYLTHIYATLVKKEIIVRSLINEEDSQYINYKNGTLSLSKFLQYAISNNWVDLSKLEIGDAYYSTEELYEKLIDYTKVLLSKDSKFNNMLYRYLIYTYKLSGNEICLLLFDQGVLEYNEGDINKLKNNSISAYSFMMDKIKHLEITPGQLALKPCSGSIVVTDVKTGEVRALVTYPGYDNNKLANTIDPTYYTSLANSLSGPFNNRPIQQRTAPGSTFKMLTTVAALEEGVVSTTEKIYDKVVFEKVTQSPKCWSKSSHGNIDISHAIKDSCNYFFFEMGWRLSGGNINNFNHKTGLKKLEKYAKMFGFDAVSGIELSEYSPQISTEDAVRSSIGQGNNNYTPSQIARYMTTIANKGTCYDLTIIDKIKDINGNTVLINKAKIHNKVQIKESTWSSVFEGLYLVVNSPDNAVSSLFKDLKHKVAGKTGTAQESKSMPNHALFVSFAPYEEPEITVTVVIPNGYNSGNAAGLARDIYKYYFKDGDTDSLVNDEVSTPEVATIGD